MKAENNLPLWRQQLNSSYVKFASLSPDKAKTELAFALQTFQNNTRLQQCEPQSIFDAIVNISRTNLSLNPITKLAYLIPRKNKCVLEISYVGLVKMLKDDGCIKHISAHLVYEDEEFNYDVPNNKITHNATYPKSEEEHKSRIIKGVYTRAELPTSDIIFDFIPTWEIEKIKGVSSYTGKGSVWDVWKLEMYKKTAIKRSFKLLIGNASSTLANVLAIEEDNNPIKSTFSNSDKPRLKTAFLEEEVEENPFTAFDDIPVKETKKSVEILVDKALEKVNDIIEEVKPKEKKAKPKTKKEVEDELDEVQAVAEMERAKWEDGGLFEDETK
jgi:phage RecT family recombinase